MTSFLLVCTLLVPLAWTICNGPKVAFVQVAGGMIALVWLAWKRQLWALLRVSPFLFAGIIYAFCAYVSAEPRDTYPYQAALVLLFYGLPAGLCLRRLVQRGQDGPVAWALLAFAVGMSLIGLLILRNPEVQRITAVSAGGFQRTNGADDTAISYLHLFSISNVIIGIVPFTLFALAALPLALAARRPVLRLAVGGAAILAGYANIQIATRTTLMATVLSGIMVIILAFRSIPRRRLLVCGASVAVLLLAGVGYVGAKSDRFQYLVSRFSEMGSDSRLDIWSEAAKILIRTPDGHGIRQLQSHEWAHNLFLDVGLTDGWMAIAAMMALYGGAFYFAWRAVRTAGFFESAAGVIMLGWLLSTFVAGMVLPPQAAFLATMHFALGYFAPCRAPAYATPAEPLRTEREQPWFPAPVSDAALHGDHF
ncbi:MAG TPA: hypothetical protein VFB27_14245 [Opitutaceae bacterium]|nr:hypothetical protein [Opitutaceae bacterium]